MDDLITFLKARLDEDAARARGEGPQLVVYGEDGRPLPPTPAWTGGYSQRRVLAEVDAKRRIVEVHTIDGIPDAHDCPGTWVGYCDDPDEPCPTLRLLALPYADHPDYQQAWRP